MIMMDKSSSNETSIAATSTTIESVSSVEQGRVVGTVDPSFLQSMSFATFITTTTTQTTTSTLLTNEIDQQDGNDSNGFVPITKTVVRQQQEQQEQEHRWNNTCDCSDDECNMILQRRRQMMTMKRTMTNQGYTNNGNDVPEESSIIQQSFIPPSIQEAIQSYKKQKILYGPIKRRQNRTLLHRDNTNSIALWEWIIPIGSEPLIEYNNLNIVRIVWFQQLSITIPLQTVGTGIIGTNHEERTRQTLNTITQDDIYLLVPTQTQTQSTNINTSNSIDINKLASSSQQQQQQQQQQHQSAIGWIYDDRKKKGNSLLDFDDDDDDDDNDNDVNNDNTDRTLNDDDDNTTSTKTNTSTSTDRHPAVLIIAKIPINLLILENDDNTTVSELSSSNKSYTNGMIQLAQDAFKTNHHQQQQQQQQEKLQMTTPIISNSLSTSTLSWIKFNPEQATVMKSIIQQIRIQKNG